MKLSLHLFLLSATLPILSTVAAPDGMLQNGFGIRFVVQSSPEGGQGGEAFSDLEDLPAGASQVGLNGIHSIDFSYSAQVESIQVTYILSNGSLYVAPRHGGNKDPVVTITLARDEYIDKITGKTNHVLVDQLGVGTVRKSKFETKLYGPFGRTGETNYSLNGFVAGFFGRAGDSLDNIGVYTLAPFKMSGYYGKIYGVPFDENPDTFFPTPVVKVTKIYLITRYGPLGVAYSMRFQYLLLNGVHELGRWYGPSEAEGNKTVIHISEDEVFFGIDGKATVDSIDEMTFVVYRKNGTFVKYGPFGRGDSKPFSLRGYVLGYSGLASSFSMIFGFRLYTV